MEETEAIYRRNEEDEVVEDEVEGEVE